MCSFTRLFKIITTSLIFILLSSCGLINVRGLQSGYNSLNKKNKEYVSFKTNIVITDEDINKGDSIYLVNGLQLRNIVNKYDTCLVYTFYPGCDSNKCITMDYFRDYCNEKGYKGYIVTYFLDNSIENRGIYKYLGIDYIYYGSKYVYKYAPKFLKDLKGKVEEEPSGNILLFKNGQFIKSFTLDP